MIIDSPDKKNMYMWYERDKDKQRLLGDFNFIIKRPMAAGAKCGYVNQKQWLLAFK